MSWITKLLPVLIELLPKLVSWISDRIRKTTKKKTLSELEDALNKRSKDTTNVENIVNIRSAQPTRMHDPSKDRPPPPTAS